MAAGLDGGLNPVQAVALVGVLGVGAQWLAWRFRLPSIVLMLAVGLLVGPVLGWFIPDRDLGPIYRPLIGVAVAIILFEGGLTLETHRLGETRSAVQRLVWIGAPLGWALASLTMMVTMGVPWAVAVVFGGVLVVTGPTVIAPMLRQARLKQRPAQLLQWEAIVNDPIGVLIAVFALEVVLVVHTGMSAGEAIWLLARGIGFAAAVGAMAGWLLARAFRDGWVPEYMKVPVLFVAVVAVFALTDSLLHETGLLAVTIMGMILANADLPSYAELHRFKEQATLMLVSGVFILMSASLDFATLGALNWRAGLFVLAIMALARPLQVLIPLVGSGLPMAERALVASTGPRGVVMVAVSGLFGAKLVDAGIAEGALLAPLSFILVLVTVLVHGFTLRPIAARLGLTGGDRPGLMIVGGSPFAVALAKAVERADVAVLIADPNRAHLAEARVAGVATFYGDILGEAAEHHVDFIRYGAVLAASDNDAYNTLVATDLGPEYGRDMIWQIGRMKDASRHALPTQLGGRKLADNPTFEDLNRRLAEGWQVRTTRLTEEYTLDQWRSDRPGAQVLMTVGDRGGLDFIEPDQPLKGAPGMRIVAMIPPGATGDPAQAPNGHEDQIDTTAPMRDAAAQVADEAVEQQGGV